MNRMRITVSLFLIFVVSTSYLFAQITSIPDANFEQKLIDLGYDDIIDGSVAIANISGIISLDVSSSNIADLTGLKCFTELEELNCSTNQLTSIDVSKNLRLTTLNCHSNQLTSLDVSNNTELTFLSCYRNRLTTLNVSNNVGLTSIICSINQLTSIDVSNNTELTSLNCSSNQILSLDVSTNTELNYLRCERNNLTQLDVRNLANTSINNTNFFANYNPNLTCVYVDDAAWSTANWTNIDATSTFVETEAACQTLSSELLQTIPVTMYTNREHTVLHFMGLTNTRYSAIGYNLTGQQLFSEELNQNQNTIPIETLQGGIYFIKVTNSQKESTLFKFLKK